MASSTVESPKITKYFSTTNSVNNAETKLPATPTKSGNTLDKDSSVLLTPDSTPTKESSTSQHVKETSLNSTEDTPCAQTSTAEPATTADTTDNKLTVTTAKQTKKNRKRRNKKSANSSKAELSAATTSSPKPPPQSRQKKSDPTSNNKILTDYFPVRRSGRRCLSDIKKDERNKLEQAILNKCVDGLKVVDIEGKGRGVVSTKEFKRGDFVVEYEGDLIEVKTAKDREKSYETNPDVGCYMYYFNYNNKSYCVDATKESGRLGRLLNHSKHGNCATRVVGIKNRPYLILVADTDIKAGEELLYDYGDRSKEALAAHPWLAL